MCGLRLKPHRLICIPMGHFESERLEDAASVCSSFQSHQWDVSPVVAASCLRMRTMRILFLTQYYLPESGATQNRVSDLANRLKNAGHQVTVLTAVPNHPKGEIYPGYRGRFTVTEHDAGIRIVRTWIFVTRKQTFFPRILNYLSFALLSLVVGGLTIHNIDAIIVESPPLFLGFSGYLLSKLKRAKFVFNVADLWPQSAVVLGVLRNRTLIRWTTRAEEWLYRHASLVTGQTQRIVDSIRNRCAEARIELITNGVSPEFLESAARASGSREAVHALAHFDDIHFLLIGDGPDKNRLQTRAEHEKITNVSFFSTLPTARMPQVFTAMDVVLISLRRDELFKGTLPCKLFEAMGAEVPVVGALEGEAQRIIAKANCGICVEPENTAAIVEAITTLYRDPDLRRRLGNNGRGYVSKNYNRREIAARFECFLADILSVPSLVTGRSK